MTKRRTASLPVVVLPFVACLALQPGLAGPPSAPVLSVRVEPPLDPFGQPWRVQLLAPGEGRPELVAEEPSPMTDGLALRALPDRPYLLRLLSSRGDVWQTDPQPFVVGEGKERLLAPKAERVRGSVVVGKRPLARARLTFSTADRNESVALVGDEDGVVTGLLPRLGRWHVAVSAKVLRLRREVDAEVARNPHGNELDFELNLIPRGIEGEFVDTNGERVERKVSLALDRPRTSHDSREGIEGGTFRVAWLEDGDHFVRASASYRDPAGTLRLLRSEPIPVSVSVGTADPAWLTIVLRRQWEMKGRAVTASGDGIRGAWVQRLDSLGFAEPSWSGWQRTDSEGRFHLAIPEGQEGECLLVGAPGLSVAVARIIPSTEEVVVPVEGPGGTVVLDQPYLGAQRLDGRVVALFRGGCAVFPYAFRSPGFPRPGTGPSRVDTGPRWRTTLPQLEPGPYSACAVGWTDLTAYEGGLPPFDDCVHGTLAPGGRLELTLLP